MKKILKAAISHQGSSVEYYLDACGKKGDYAKYHKVYQKEGEKCRRCGTIIKRVKLAGRSAHFCPRCQKNYDNLSLRPRYISLAAETK